MALRINKTVSIYGNNLNITCMVTVINIRGNKNELIADCQFENNNLIIDNKSYLFTPSLDGDNFIKQSYEYIKKLEEFKDAEDC